MGSCGVVPCQQVYARARASHHTPMARLGQRVVDESADFPASGGRAIIARVNTRVAASSREGLGRIDELVSGVLLYVDSEMRGQPASMVYEVLDARLERRLPGITVDEERKRDAAARISVGALIC